MTSSIPSRSPSVISVALHRLKGDYIACVYVERVGDGEVYSVEVLDPYMHLVWRPDAPYGRYMEALRVAEDYVAGVLASRPSHLTSRS